MTTTESLERDLKSKCEKELREDKFADPLDKLRAKLLARGSNSIKGLSR